MLTLSNFKFLLMSKLETLLGKFNISVFFDFWNYQIRFINQKYNLF